MAGKHTIILVQYTNAYQVRTVYQDLLRNIVNRF
jgi:hypothetical protein